MRQSLATSAADALSHPKWQVQNKVGGGGLYGIVEEASSSSALGRAGSSSMAAAGSPFTRHTATSGSPQHSSNSSLNTLGRSGSTVEDSHAASTSTPQHRGSKALDGVDIVYLKNVLLKFMEAAVTGKVQERDVLLPAVAALLQATPAEFAVLKRIISNTTTPPAMQMLTSLGKWI